VDGIKVNAVDDVRQANGLELLSHVLELEENAASAFEFRSMELRHGPELIRAPAGRQR